MSSVALSWLRNRSAPPCTDHRQQFNQAHWLIQQRLDRARHLLECTDLPVDAVARQVGFGTALSLRQHLRAPFGVSPAGYRRIYQDATRLGADDVNAVRLNDR